jgi:signal transduction histidine kinase
MNAVASKHCLLVVDDEPDLVQSVKDLLRFDYRVLGTTRATEGLKIMENEQVHIVMTDQRMPEMTGVEFLKCLRDTFPETVRLLFTAYADIEAVTDAINQGNVYRYISKPWEPQELKGILRQAVEHYDLQAERKRLIREVQEKNRQLEAANTELRQANELKRCFIRVASHELRTPLSIVLGLSELGSKSADTPPHLKAWLEQIFNGSLRLTERVDQMVKLLLAEHFERPLQPRPVALNPLLQKSAAAVATFAQLRKQALVIDVADDLGAMSLEEDKIHDSIVQLLINAIKFTPDGGTIKLSARRTGEGNLEISVTDSGIGIDPQSLPRIFEPFFTRFDVSRHSSGTFEFDRRGLGLGLSVVKAFVEMHGGKIKVQSELKRGSTFTISLPDKKTNGELKV